jgi:polysaccharide pyruvyl transferase WcaK-like protein
MRILIIGWYGTETIGDRAILAGLIQLLTKELGEIDLTLGSLYPFFSERTVHEDKTTILKTSHADVNLSIIDSSNSVTLKKTIMQVDLVIMGGGPLMDLSELFMVDYAFKLAKKNKKNTAILGCGVGPLFKKEYRKSVASIVKNSDVIVLRDNTSKNNLMTILKEFSEDISKYNLVVGFDPAVHYTHRALLNKIDNKCSSDYICVNLRSFPSEYSLENKKIDVNEKLENFIQVIADRFTETNVLLVPMHYFHIGDDDRYFLNKIKFNSNKSNIKVQNKPLTLEQTVETYSNAMFNIGMRFHSVVLQTISNGKNYILDYTEPKKGKISGFINDIDKTNFYSGRYICLQEQQTDIVFDFSSYSSKFIYDLELIKSSEDSYTNQIKLTS